MEIPEIDKKEQLRLRNKVKNLLKKPQPIQRSKSWFELRNVALSASEIAACLTFTPEVCEDYLKQFNVPDFKINGKCCSHFDTKEDFIVNKCRAFFGENVFVDSIFTLWGKKYEEIATRLYRINFNTQVLEFGSLVHPRLKWLRCSPDGITRDGTLVEIKCPFKRKINGFVPFHYYLQCMLQLEVCDLETCDFLECELIELKTLDEFINYPLIEFSPGKFQAKGILINKVSEVNNSETKYIYPPDNLLTTEDFINWYTQVSSTIEVQVQPIFYVIVKWGVIQVKRNKEWFDKIIKPILKENHTFIRKLQKDKELFDKYRESIHLIKNKTFIEMYNKTECLLEIGNDSDSDFYIEENETEIEIDTCLLSEN
jgi:hypothetical protein